MPKVENLILSGNGNGGLTFYESELSRPQNSQLVQSDVMGKVDVIDA